MENNLSDNLAFHAILEREITKLEFGQMDVSVILRDGLIAIETVNILKSKRIKYKDGARTTKYDE